jgi:hypothetical protein
MVGFFRYTPEADNQLATLLTLRRSPCCIAAGSRALRRGPRRSGVDMPEITDDEPTLLDPFHGRPLPRAIQDRGGFLVSGPASTVE